MEKEQCSERPILIMYLTPKIRNRLKRFLFMISSRREESFLSSKTMTSLRRTTFLFQVFLQLMGLYISEESPWLR